jgi:hypothetical protein
MVAGNFTSIFVFGSILLIMLGSNVLIMPGYSQLHKVPSINDTWNLSNLIVHEPVEYHFIQLNYPSVKLTINPVPSWEPPGLGYYYVVISGSGFYGGKTGIIAGANLKGDDPVFDDHIYVTPRGGYLGSDGKFTLSATVRGNLLNEDWEGKDEIYANVYVGGYSNFKTNVVKGYYK